MPADALDVRFTTVLDLGYWSYTTVVADATSRFTPVVSDPESIAAALGGRRRRRRAAAASAIRRSLARPAKPALTAARPARNQAVRSSGDATRERGNHGTTADVRAR